MPKLSWKETDIYIQLKGRTGQYAESIINLLERPEVMDKIESILDKGGTIPKDFTLHDADHSFRVANTMWQLIATQTKAILSDYELGLLLLSAFLHDIGMSPDFEKVEKHREYLISDSKNQLTEFEINELQKWIDNDDKPILVDIREEKIDDVKLLNYILSYYIRYKHNDWSGEWIKSNLGEFPLKNYKDWSDDLIKICKSHHYGIEYLKKDIFDPIPISTDVIVHVRYLSMCLRVADVMENDPERTPEVILKHRLISESSIKYWIKDKQYNLTRAGNKFTLYSRPDRAYLHKAIEETANWIEDELRLCDELIKDRPLRQSHFKDLNLYEWDIEAFIFKDILPKDDTYVYIQGAFRPNTARILELLGGNQLYGNSIWAYRELIQNSFDAVKERIAYQIINDDKSPDEFLERLGEIYSIELILEKRTDGIWLICKDQGVGMTKTIIEKFFLESGSSKRHEINELERKCKNRGFTFSRTGQFGIGVLSYFMIADKVIVKTKRELNTGYSDDESKAWYFEINGSHGFGELRKFNKTIVGTQVEFKLKIEIEKNINEWNNSFSSFIKATVAYSPCNVSYKSFLENDIQKINPGWSNTLEDVRNTVTTKFESDFSKRRYVHPMLSLNEKKRITKIEDTFKDVAKGISNSLHFLSEEGEITGVGRYRICIPYFKLIGGNSYLYFKENANSNSHFILNNGSYWQPQFKEIYFSLKGIKIKVLRKVEERDAEFDEPTISIAHIEIDIEAIEDASLSVSRHSLLIDKNYLFLKKLIDEKVDALIASHAHTFNNIYSLFNKKYTKIVPLNPHLPFIDIIKNEEKIILKPLKFPFTYSYRNSYLNAEYGGEKLNLLHRPTIYFGSEEFELINNIEIHFRLGILRQQIRNGRFQFGYDSFLIASGLQANTILDEFIAFNYIDLPSSWNILFIIQDFVYDNPNVLLNSNSEFIKDFDFEFYLRIKDLGLNIRVEDLNNKKVCLAFLILSVLEYSDRWVGLCETNENLFKKLFHSLNIDNFFIIYEERVVRVSFAGWRVVFSNKELLNITPNISDINYIVKELNKVEIKKGKDN